MSRKNAKNAAPVAAPVNATTAAPVDPAAAAIAETARLSRLCGVDRHAVLTFDGATVNVTPIDGANGRPIARYSSPATCDAAPAFHGAPPASNPRALLTFAAAILNGDHDTGIRGALAAYYTNRNAAHTNNDCSPLDLLLGRARAAARIARVANGRGFAFDGGCTNATAPDFAASVSARVSALIAALPVDPA
jgi:hypothetical protein